VEFGNIQFVFSYDDFRVRLFASTFFEKFDINSDSLPFHLDIAIHEKYTEWLHQTYVQLTFWSFDSNFPGQYGARLKKKKKKKMKSSHPCKDSEGKRPRWQVFYSEHTTALFTLQILMMRGRGEE